MSAHTPGPWKKERWYQGFFITAPAQNGTINTPTIAELREAPLGAFYSHQCEANASLIAKAPEMFEFLCELWADSRFLLHDTTRGERLAALLREIDPRQKGVMD